MFDKTRPFKERQFQKFSDHTYSQHGEDLMILNLCHMLGLEKPSYLDIGAFHPTQISNTALLYENGSRGVNIEANENLIGAFHAQRPEDKNICACIGPRRGVQDFYVESPTSVLNSLNKDHILRQDAKIAYSRAVSVITLQDVIDTYCNAVFPDILFMDIEGMDDEVLNSFDFSVTAPKIICAEISSEAVLSLIKPGRALSNFSPYYKMVSNIFLIENHLHSKLWLE